MQEIRKFKSDCCKSEFDLKHNIWNCLQCKKEICKACNPMSFICEECRNVIINKIVEGKR